MHLYLLEDIGKDRTEYDDRSMAVVVAAGNPEESRRVAGGVADNGKMFDGSDYYGEKHYLSEKRSTVRCIGTASADITEPCVIVVCIQPGTN